MSRPNSVTDSPVMLIEGQRLDQPAFHALYEATPPGTRVELVGGVVYMPSPVGREHAKAQVPNGIKFSQEVRPERVTTNRACILYQIITITPTRPSPPPSTNYLIIMFCVFGAQYPPPHSIKVKSSVSSIIYSAYAAKSFSLKSLRNSALGFFMSGYCLGRRFLTRGSYRPGRDGLTTNSGISSPSSAPRSHRSASTKLIRSAITP